MPSDLRPCHPRHGTRAARPARQIPTFCARTNPRRLRAPSNISSGGSESEGGARGTYLPTAQRDAFLPSCTYSPSTQARPTSPRGRCECIVPARSDCPPCAHATPASRAPSRLPQAWHRRAMVLDAGRRRSVQPVLSAWRGSSVRGLSIWIARRPSIEGRATWRTPRRANAAARSRHAAERSARGRRWDRARAPGRWRAFSGVELFGAC
ncbi:hypothetical protein FA95DRAFT_1024202 [Auriscalpium vulgare]|uniref:Uncharacterized protein n=1 Tax=Auriscalpium vulgare TaxID=40419 RepID=A0ACB8RYC5_9AGAM|nr:hypothetical protein FA95DRAFT_1024202 [Auriscalpium vulgare]